jgi:Zn-dependent protease with chaperone function
MPRLLISSALILAAFLSILPRPAGASEPNASPAVKTTQEEAGGHKPVAVPVPPASPEAMRYYRSGNVLWTVFTLLEILIPGIWAFSGWSARLRTLAQRIGRRWFFTIAVYYVLFTLITFLVMLPLDYYAGFVRQHAYGMSNQSLLKWGEDTLKQLALNLLAGCLVLWIPYWFLARTPRRWWLYTGLLVPPLLVLVMLILPIWIDPLFNRFGPVKDRRLEEKIVALARRAGIEHGRIFEVDKSVDTKAENAYVTGLWCTQRIVLWDTLLSRFDEQELMFVLGHEMGHYVMHHVLRTILVASAAVLLGLYLVHRAAGPLVRRFSRRLGFAQLADVASLPLLVMLLSLVSLGIRPVVLAYSRYQEHQADAFGLELTGDRQAAAHALVKLQQDNLGNPRPGPIYMTFRATHPSLGQRIDFCNSGE